MTEKIVEEYYRFLKDIFFFKDLSEEELKEIAKVCHEEKYSAGEIIFSEGIMADKFYIVMDGTVEVWKDFYQEERDLLAVHGKGHFFGEMSLIDELPRSATVSAREHTRVLFLYRNDFHSIIMADNKIALSIMISVSSMVRKSNENFVENLRKRNKELESANKELRETQQELLRAERLSTLGKFSSMILHDIRNPISVVKGYAEMTIYHADNQDRVKKAGNKIIQEANRLNMLAGELLDYSRGEIRLNIELVDVNDLFDSVIQSIEDRCVRKNIEIKKEVDLGNPILLDKERMRRVIFNLTDNSRKAMPKGGGKLTLRAKKEKANIIISVHDTGEGMGKEVLNHIFEPFYSSSSGGGTGLGMLIVKNVVEAHDGTLELESTPENGTSVYLRFPEA